LTRHSPCVGICTLDETTGYCLGCGRSRDEVAQWVAMSEDQREAVWLKLPPRLETLGVRVRLLPWTPEDILVWVAETITGRRGTWTIGASRAAENFPCTAKREIEIEELGDAVVARAPHSSFRLRINDKVRAFAFAEGGPIALAMPRGRATIASCADITALGPDADAIDERRQRDWLFDLGFGCKSSRFCIRTDDATFADILSAHAGRRWPEIVPTIADQIVSLRPTRIIETAVARIEVCAPPVGDAAGTPARGLPAFLKPSDNIPATPALPDYASPVAIFYPTMG
jgi:predicted Fe-S protein YdhL (DUF1289 family)